MQTQENKLEASLVILPFHVKSQGRDLRFFINVQKVAKVFAYKPLTPFLDPLGVISGLYDDNGIPIPVVDLRMLLTQQKLPPSLCSPDGSVHSNLERIIVCSIMGHLVGFLVDRTKKIERWQNIDLQPPIDLPGLNDDLVQGMLRDEQGFRYMINVEHILISSGLHQVETRSQTGQSLQGKRIILVEDSIFFRKMASQALRNQGAEVVEAHHGQDGLRLLLDDDRFDLGIVDIEMPFINGIEMVRRYKGEKPESKLPFLFHTSMSNEVLFKELEEEKLGRCLAKLSSEELLQTVRDMITARA
ncbi:MAG TPA: response regulator [Oligoflexus sp.]|uniref:chemotaxis protein CheV n=1 Tax=Oligoflexus sp. TaxID=1971216 RepID=UPI002D80F7DA|nr:response regulator [Oligoflexus sp.]HET9240074.1 response regulator [Oligoflexus sp.]